VLVSDNNQTTSVAVRSCDNFGECGLRTAKAEARGHDVLVGSCGSHPLLRLIIKSSAASVDHFASAVSSCDPRMDSGMPVSQVTTGAMNPRPHSGGGLPAPALLGVHSLTDHLCGVSITRFTLVPLLTFAWADSRSELSWRSPFPFVPRNLLSPFASWSEHRRFFFSQPLSPRNPPTNGSPWLHGLRCTRIIGGGILTVLSTSSFDFSQNLSLWLSVVIILFAH
jgi:hypothetical protein